MRFLVDTGRPPSVQDVLPPGWTWTPGHPGGVLAFRGHEEVVDLMDPHVDPFDTITAVGRRILERIDEEKRGGPCGLPDVDAAAYLLG